MRLIVVYPGFTVFFLSSVCVAVRYIVLFTRLANIVTSIHLESHSVFNFDLVKNPSTCVACGNFGQLKTFDNFFKTISLTLLSADVFIYFCVNRKTTCTKRNVKFFFFLLSKSLRNLLRIRRPRWLATRWLGSSFAIRTCFFFAKDTFTLLVQNVKNTWSACSPLINT